MRKKILFIIGSILGLSLSWGQTIENVEYFFDSDPGVGNGSTLSIETNTGQISQTYAIPTTGLAEGYHSLYIRTKSNLGVWSHYDRKIFLVMAFTDANQTITGAEYFFDADPGIGEGTVLTLDINAAQEAQNLVIPATELEEGVHVLYIRVRSEKGIWSLYDSRSFEVTADALDNSVTLIGNTITADLDDATYQWLDCGNSNTPIENETGRSFTASESGSYAVEISVGDRTAVSICTEVTVGVGGDQDNDGVPDTVDQCANTPEEAAVDVNGCPIFTLPTDNFTLKVTGESCIASNNGSIEISAKTALNYSVTLTGLSETQSNTFTENIMFPNLMAGTYGLCISVVGQPEYEKCFDVTVTEPEAISVSSKLNIQNNELTLKLSGSKNYTIVLNGETTTTSENKLTLSLLSGENSLSVKGEKECQGLYVETVVLNTKAFIYPNPITNGNLHVNIGSNEQQEKANVFLYTLNGILILEKQYILENGNLLLDMNGLSSGIYILNVKAGKTTLNQKIIKK